MERIAKKLLSLSTWLKDREWGFFKTRRFFKDFFNGIRNLVVWFPVIWRDRDWDWQYLSDIMQFKLNKMADSFERSGLGGERIKLAFQMREVACHLRDLEDDFTPDREDGKPLTIEDHVAHEKKLKNHLTRACYIMGTNMRYWWD